MSAQGSDLSTEFYYQRHFHLQPNHQGNTLSYNFILHGDPVTILASSGFVQVLPVASTCLHLDIFMEILFMEALQLMRTLGSAPRATQSAHALSQQPAKNKSSEVVRF